MNARLWGIELLILGAGAFVRFYHVDFGLPDLVAVDGFKFVGEAGRMVSTGDWRPQIFQYPGLLTYVLAVFYRACGMQNAYEQYVTAHVIAGLAGMALTLTTWYAARAVCGRVGQRLAMALVALCPISVTLSRTPAPDLLMATFMTAAMALVVSDSARTKSFAVAGVLGGLAAGAKFTGVFVLPFLVVAAVLYGAPSRSRAEVMQRCAMVVVASAGAFLATTPWFVPLVNSYRHAILQELEIQRVGQIGRVQGGYFDYLLSPTPTWEQPWLATSIGATLGIPVLAAGIAGMVLALFGRGGRRLFFYAAYIIIYVAAISGPGRVKAIRFLVPVLPLFYVVLAWGVETAIGRLIAPSRRWVRGFAGAFAALILLMVPLQKTAGLIALTRRPSTNALAYEWGRTHLEPGAVTLLSPFFVSNLAQLPIRAATIQQVGSRQYRFPEGVGPSPERNPIYTPELIDKLRASGVRYLILNSYFDDAFSAVRENQQFFPQSVAHYSAFMERLASAAELIYAVKGFTEGRLGPDISIYRLGAMPPAPGS